MIGRYITAPGTKAKVVVVARALGFAQAPGVFAVVVPFFLPLVAMAAGIVVPYEPSSAATPPATHRVRVIARALGLSVQSLLSVGVLVGTYLAVRETLRLSNGRTLGALLIAGTSVALLLRIIVAAFALATPLPVEDSGHLGPAFFGLTGRGDRFGIPDAAAVAGELDFNLRLGRPLMWLFDVITD